MIAQSHTNNAYELVSRYRSEWLRRRGAPSLRPSSGIRVYLGHMELGGVESLRDLNVNMIDSIQFLSGPDATQRFGINHGDGAIVVTPIIG